MILLKEGGKGGGGGLDHHDYFVKVKMCHSPNPTPLGFMHMQTHCFQVSCDIFASRTKILIGSQTPSVVLAPNCACVAKFMHV